MMILGAYFGFALLAAPALIRRAYKRLRRTHPRTHPRDVRYDLSRAVAQGSAAAILWLPLGLVAGCRTAVVVIGWHIIGKPARRDLSTARTVMFEDELARLAWQHDLDRLEAELRLYGDRDEAVQARQLVNRLRGRAA